MLKLRQGYGAAADVVLDGGEFNYKRSINKYMKEGEISNGLRGGATQFD